MTKSTKFSGAAANTRVLSRLDGLFADDAARREVRREVPAGAPPDRPPDDGRPGRRLLAQGHAGVSPPLADGSDARDARAHGPVPGLADSVLPAPGVPDSVLPAPAPADSVLSVPALPDSVLPTSALADSVLLAPGLPDSALPVPGLADSVPRAPGLADSVLRTPALADSVLPMPGAPERVRSDPVPADSVGSDRVAPAPGRQDSGAAEEGDTWERVFAGRSDPYTSAESVAVVTDEDPRLPAVPLRDRFADAVADRIPPHLKALRVGMDRRAVAAVAVLALLAVVLAGVGWWRARPQEVAVPPVVGVSTRATSGPGAERARVAPGSGPAASAAVAGAEASAASPAPSNVSVHVVGKVAQPGVLALPAGSRVDDALKAAGGALPGTDLSVLNLARVLVDGEQIPVGVPGATAPPPVPAAAPGPAAAGAGGGKAAAGGVVDLNTATAEQLDALPGIGPVMAAHILDWRRDHGRFTSVDQLREIRGIGARRLEEIRPRVRV